MNAKIKKEKQMNIEICKHCGQNIQMAKGYYPTVWVDNTDGDGCLQENSTNQVHEPQDKGETNEYILPEL